MRCVAPGQMQHPKFALPICNMLRSWSCLPASTLDWNTDSGLRGGRNGEVIEQQNRIVDPDANTLTD